MRPHHSYWLLTAVLLSLLIFSIDYGVVSWFIDKFPSIDTQIATTIFVLIFLYAYANIGFRTGIRLNRDRTLLEELNRLLPCDAKITEKERAIRTILIDRHAFNSFESAIARSLNGLGLRTRTVLETKASEPINQEMYQNDVEDAVADGLDMLEAIRTILLLLGLLGTVIGIILAIAGQAIPVTPEDSKIFSFTMIKGMGLAYVTSMFGMGGGLILYVLILFYQHSAKNICRGFRELMFHTFFPIIHSPSFNTDGVSEHAASQ